MGTCSNGREACQCVQTVASGPALARATVHFTELVPPTLPRTAAILPRAPQRRCSRRHGRGNLVARLHDGRPDASSSGGCTCTWQWRRGLGLLLTGPGRASGLCRSLRRRTDLEEAL